MKEGRDYVLPKLSDPNTTKRLLNEYQRVKKFGDVKVCSTFVVSLPYSNGIQGFDCRFVENNLYHWEVKLFNTFDENVPLSWELELYKQKTGIGYIRLQVLFPNQYPLSPPQVYVMEPRFRSHSTKTVKIGGTVSCDLLNERSNRWSPIVTVETIIQELKTLLALENASIIYDVCCPYSEVESYAEAHGFYKPFQAVPLCELKPELDIQTAGGRVVLPPSALHHIIQSEMNNFPILLEICNETLSKKIYCGVQNFDGPEYMVGIPQWLMENLGIDSGAHVNIRTVSLEKGTFARLQPTESVFLDLDQPKEVLESILRAYPAMQTGQFIEVCYEGATLRLNVLETQPTKAIQLLNTDLEVEFDFSLIPQDAFDARQSKTDLEDEPMKNTSSGHVLDSEVQGESSLCDNCKKNVPIASFDMHTMFCLRNNVLCPKCGIVVQKSTMEHHTNEFHKLVPCVCGESVEFYRLQAHKQDECGHRPLVCRYCHLKKKAQDLESHEKDCGTRTEQCEKCNQWIRVQDLAKHQESQCTPVERSFVRRLIGFLGIDTT